MNGLPMNVAIALGLLLSEIAPAPWTGRMITFAEAPAWFTCPDDARTLEARVAAVADMPWGTTTNFAAALELVLNTAMSLNVAPGSEAARVLMPEVLFVFTDMQFDEAGGMDPHAAAMVQRRFTECGYKVPHVVFWNLRATGAPIYQAETSDVGVSFMSGFSQQMFADFLENGVLSSGAVVTPWETLRTRLCRDGLLAVRRLCAAVGEGPMAGYSVPEELEVAAAARAVDNAKAAKKKGKATVTM
jgi:hypothetical protein